MRAKWSFLGVLTLALSFAWADNPNSPAQSVISPSSTPAVYSNERLLAREVDRILNKSSAYLIASPVTVTAFVSPNSEGGPNDFYSEGDYWWPDPENPEGPYIRRDGLTNPDNFVAHRKALMRFSEIVGTLTSAYLISGEQKYVDAAAEHLRAWFVDTGTRMNPTLLYAQAVKGHSSGRSIGIIDTIHLTEVARSVQILGAAGQLTPADENAITAWFGSYLNWLKTHPYGIQERQHPNNHAICWAMQAAAFADLVDDQAMLANIRVDFKEKFVGDMMASNGSFPAELARTKAYGYSLFVLDAMATLAQIASTSDDDLWHYRAQDGRGMRRAMNYMLPYINDKNLWPLTPDVLYWDEWPVRQPSLIFAAEAYGNNRYLVAWERLDPDPDEYEVLRNLPVRHPLLWLPFSGTQAGHR